MKNRTDSHPAWCATEPRCFLGHASAERTVLPDDTSPTAVGVRLWQLTNRTGPLSLVVELEFRTHRGARHVAALSLEQAGELSWYLVELGREVAGIPQKTVSRDLGITQVGKTDPYATAQPVGRCRACGELVTRIVPTTGKCPACTEGETDA